MAIFCLWNTGISQISIPEFGIDFNTGIPEFGIGIGTPSCCCDKREVWMCFETKQTQGSLFHSLFRSSKKDIEN